MVTKRKNAVGGKLSSTGIGSRLSTRHRTGAQLSSARRNIKRAQVVRRRMAIYAGLAAVRANRNRSGTGSRLGKR